MDIYPNEFYTDFMLFKNRAASFNDADIIVLFAGSCQFSKRHVLDIVRTLRKRADDEKDTGIRSLTIFTDVFLPSIDKYYKFRGKLTSVSEYSGWKVKEKDSDIWSRVPHGSRGMYTEACYLTPYDNGDVTKLREAYKNVSSSHEGYRGLIKKPDFSSISEI